ncbi:MAG: FkbM family methyltransferase [Nanoarchaeota archaeon]
MTIFPKVKRLLMILAGIIKGIHYVPSNYLFKGKFNEGDTIIDVGCGFDADFSVYMIKRFGLTSIGIDPTLKHVDSLKTINNNMNCKFKHYPIAISANDGEIIFNESEDNVSGSILKEHKNVRNDRIKTYSVKSVSLEKLPDYLGLNKIKYIKLDIEGAEYDLIKGLESEDLNKYEQIFIEFHHHATNYSMNDTLNRVKRMSSFGFKSFTLNNHDFLFYRK